MKLRIACAGWALPKNLQDRFPQEGTHLGRYSQKLNAVEINSSFYRYHKAASYARWARETPDDFQFALKVPRLITHEQRLSEGEEAWLTFQSGFEQLGSKLGPLLLQLPPSLRFKEDVVHSFLSMVRRHFKGQMVCEPRHKSWFEEEAAACLKEHEVGRVAADPALLAEAAEPLGEGRHPLVYYRLHGSPVIYESDYEDEWLDRLGETLAAAAEHNAVWCVFDNTTFGCAIENALYLREHFHSGAGKKSHSKSLTIPPHPT